MGFFNFIIFVFLSLKPMQNGLIGREQIPPTINNKKILSLYTRSELLKGSGILLLYPSFYLAKSLYARYRREQSKSFSLLPLCESSGIYLTSQAIRLRVYFDQAKKIINNKRSLEIEGEERINQRKKSFNNKILSAFNIFQETNTENIKNYVKNLQEVEAQRLMNDRRIKTQEKTNKIEELLGKAYDIIFKIKRLILDYNDNQSFKQLNFSMNNNFDRLNAINENLDNTYGFDKNHINYKDELQKFFFDQIKYINRECTLCRIFFLMHWLFEDETENKKDLEEFIEIIKNRIKNNKDSLTQKTINSALLTFRKIYIFDMRCPEARAIFFDNNLFFPLFKITAKEEINTIINFLFIENTYKFSGYFKKINFKDHPLIKFLKDNNITYKMIRDDINSDTKLNAEYKTVIFLKEIDSLEKLSSE